MVNTLKTVRTMPLLYTLFLVLGLTIAPNLWAQNEHLSKVKQEVESVENAVKEAKQAGDMANLFVNQIRVNHLQASIPPFGKYQKEAAFWYAETPKQAKRNARNPLDALQKIVLRSQLMGKTYESTYVFHKHELIQFTTKGGEEALVVYYYDGKAIHFVQNDKEYEQLNAFQLKRASTPLRNAEKLQNLYLASFLD